MENVKISTKDQIIMSLVHYFVTVESYTPIVVKGAKDEIWLENLDSPIKIVRINSNYIHNDEQHNMDVLKLNFVLKQIKRKTLTFQMNAINICIDVADRVNLQATKKIENISIKSVEEIKENKVLKNIFPNIETEVIAKSDNLDLVKNVTNDINNSTQKRNKVFEDIFKSKKIIVTYAIIAICVLLYILTVAFDYSLLYYGANQGYFVVELQEYYRLFTSIFLHGSLLHLFVNMYSLNILGKQLETFVGKTKFLIIFLLSGLTGSLFSILINGYSTYSVGASGAIFGIAAALIYFGYYYRVYLNNVLIRQLVPVIAFNLALGFMMTGIDNAAHIGGLIGGYMAASIVGIKEKTDKIERRNSSIAFILLILFLIYIIFMA